MTTAEHRGEVDLRGQVVGAEEEADAAAAVVALESLRDWTRSLEAVAIVQAESPELRAFAEDRPDSVCEAVRAAIPALATIYHPRVVRQIVAILRNAADAVEASSAHSSGLSDRLTALEELVAGAGAVLAHAPDPSPTDSLDHRLEVLEATVSGAGAVLRDA